MMEKRRFLPIAAIAAVALVAAACSSSDDDATTTEMMPEEMESTVAEITAGLFERAQDARTAADDAAEAAAEDVMAATEAADGLTTEEVSGDSAMAMANAQAILDAQDDTAQAVMDAQAALDDANAAETEAADLDNSSLDAAIAAAIEAAEGAVKAATASRDDETLKTAGEEVTGADPEAEGYPTTPTDIAEGVAMDIGMALLPTTGDDGAGTRVMHSSDAEVPAARSHERGRR